MQKINLYGGEHPLFFDSTSHRYFDKDKVPVLNATAANDVLAKPNLIGWAARMSAQHIRESLDGDDDRPNLDLLYEAIEEAPEAHTRYSKERMLLGTGVHKYIDKVLRHELGLRKKMPPLPDHDMMRNSIRAYMRYRSKRRELAILESERIVFHPENKHCGTADFVGCYPGARYVIGDWKTGSMVSIEAALQCASYCKAAERELGHVFEREIVHINCKNGHLSIWDEERIQSKLTRNDVDTDYEQFLRNCDTWRWYSGTNDGWRL